MNQRLEAYMKRNDGELKIFKNVGSRIRGLAGIIFAIGVLASVIGGLYMLSESPIKGIAVVVGGLIVSYLSTLGLFAFGVLIENSDIRTDLAIQAALERENEKKCE